jgi:hypothetical protein
MEPSEDRQEARAAADAKAAEAMADSAFIDACEEVISVDHQARMTQ